MTTGAGAGGFPVGRRGQRKPWGWAAMLLVWGIGLSSVSGTTLIEQAYQAGELDLQTALLYQVEAFRDPQTVPAPYREAPSVPVCGTPMVVQAQAFAQQAGEAYERRLAKVLARPRRSLWVLTPDGHFRVHYDVSGAAAVDPSDIDGNGVPDYVDEVVRTLDRVWHLEVDSLGFQPPPSDGDLGGGPEYDVYISELGRGGTYGKTYPERPGKATCSYLELDNDYANSIYRESKGLNALHVTVAHEFNHGIQFGYYQGSDGIWWQEATATWMEDVAYPYQAAIAYDADLLDAPLPTVMQLGPAYPNPFRPSIHGMLSLPYQLDRPSRVTHLTILDGVGRLVRYFDLGRRGQRSAVQTWDGTNQAGARVGSGIYYAVLEADGRHARSRIAVIHSSGD